MKNNYLPYKMKVVSIKPESMESKSLILEFVDKKEAKEFSFMPGQFIILSLLGYGEGVFAITSSVNNLPNVEILVRSVGNLTQAIHRLKPGDVVGLRGPYGKPFPMEEIKGQEILLFAGGIGLAPLRSLIKTVEDNIYTVGKLKIFVGARSPEYFIYKKELKEWQKFSEVHLSVNTCDANWKGCVGLITDLLKETEIRPNSVAILCGPPAMIVPVVKKLNTLKIKDENIYVMLERRMKCGIGKCQHCTCGEKYVCTDGPTFSWSEIKDNWEAFV